jgi:hypothetical protein
MVLCLNHLCTNRQSSKHDKYLTLDTTKVRICLFVFHLPLEVRADVLVQRPDHQNNTSALSSDPMHSSSTSLFQARWHFHLCRAEIFHLSLYSLEGSRQYYLRSASSGETDQRRVLALYVRGYGGSHCVRPKRQISGARYHPKG